jgi:hypothetical protein
MKLSNEKMAKICFGLTLFCVFLIFFLPRLVYIDRITEGYIGIFLFYPASLSALYLGIVLIKRNYYGYPVKLIHRFAGVPVIVYYILFTLNIVFRNWILE